MATILIRHATSGLQTPYTHMTTPDSPSVDEVLSGIGSHSVTLPFMSLEGHIRYVEFIRTDPS